MDDRELVLAAAEAAGVVGEWVETHGTDVGQDAAGVGRRGARWGDRLWNPLENDADALRLAVDLGMELSLWGTDVFARTGSIALAQVPAGDDRRGAVRRAITRAAAQRGAPTTFQGTARFFYKP